jgi:hypothetical protein
MKQYLSFLFILCSLFSNAQTTFTIDLPTKNTFKENKELPVFLNQKKYDILVFSDEFINRNKVRTNDFVLEKKGVYVFVKDKNENVLFKTNGVYDRIWDKDGQLLARKKVKKDGLVYWKRGEETVMTVKNETLKKLQKISIEQATQNDALAYLGILERIQNTEDTETAMLFSTVLPALF